MEKPKTAEERMKRLRREMALMESDKLSKLVIEEDRELLRRLSEV